MPPLSPFHRSCLALAIGHVMALPVAHAATIEVNVFDDTGSESDECTLREAIDSANSNSVAAGSGCDPGEAGLDTITFQGVGAGQTIALDQTMALSITSGEPLIIDGPGQDLLTIDGSGNGTAGIFYLKSATVSLDRLTIANGNRTYGGGIYAYTSSVSLTNSTVSGNSAVVDGGGIYAGQFSNVSLTNSTVSENVANHAMGEGGGIRAYLSSVTLNGSTVLSNNATYGGGIFIKTNSFVSLTNNSTVSDNMAARGAGIDAAISSSVTLANSTISDNTASNLAAGIFVNQSSIVNMTNSSVSGNSTGGFGGGIDAQNSSKVNLTNSTVSGNMANYGSGIFAFTSVTVNLTNSTVSDNLAINGGGIYVRGSSTANLTNSTLSGNSASADGGGIRTHFTSNVILINSIVSGNSATTGAEISNVDNASPITANDANLFGDSSHTNTLAFVNFTPGTNDINANYDDDLISLHVPTSLSSILQPLTINDGQTKTHALVTGSPAIDAGNQTACTDNGIITDQRGKQRIDGACDIGSFELFRQLDEGACYVINGAGSKTIVFCL